MRASCKRGGKFPYLKMLPVDKWREKFRLLLLLRKATILTGSGKKLELTSVQEIYIAFRNMDKNNIYLKFIKCSSDLRRY